MNAFFQTLAQSAMLSRLFRPFEFFIFILFLFFWVSFFLSSHVAGNCLRVEHGCFRPSILAPLTHPGLSCIDLRLVSRNGPRMLCCANKLLTNPPHAMTDTKKDCWKGTCSTPKACLVSIGLGSFCAHHIQHLVLSHLTGPFSPT